MRAPLGLCVLLSVSLIACRDWSVPPEDGLDAEIAVEDAGGIVSDTSVTDSRVADSSPEKSDDGGGADASVGASVDASGTDAGCPAGFREGTTGCEDVDECLEGNLRVQPDRSLSEHYWIIRLHVQAGLRRRGPLGIACMPRITVGHNSAGAPHFCALDPAGQLLCWGNNAAGQLGDGTRADRATPAPTTGLTNVAFVVAGDAATCAVLLDRSVRCWGDKAGKSWGEGSLTPVALGGLRDVVRLSLSTTGCAVDINGGVFCWGENSKGQVGNGEATGIPASRPVRVAGLGPAAWVSNGYNQTVSCAGLKTGAAYCWGEGLLTSNATATASVAPVALPGLSDALDVQALAGRSCVRRYSREVFCWGPTTSDPGLGWVTSNAVGLLGGNYHTCVVKNPGGLECWDIGTKPLNVVDSSDVIVAVAHAAQTYGLTATGTLKSWNMNTATPVRGPDIKLW